MDEALPLPEGSELLRVLLRNGEQSNLDFKLKPGSTSDYEFARDLSAVYNSPDGAPYADHGFLVLGVGDDLRVVGLKRGEFDDADLAACAARALSFVPSYDIVRVDLPCSDREVVILVIHKWPVGPVRFTIKCNAGAKKAAIDAGDVFFRVGTSTARVSWTNRFDCERLRQRFGGLLVQSVPPGELSRDPVGMLCAHVRDVTLGAGVLPLQRGSTDVRFVLAGMAGNLQYPPDDADITPLLQAIPFCAVLSLSADGDDKNFEKDSSASCRTWQALKSCGARVRQCRPDDVAVAGADEVMWLSARPKDGRDPRLATMAMESVTCVVLFAPAKHERALAEQVRDVLSQVCDAALPMVIVLTNAPVSLLRLQHLINVPVLHLCAPICVQSLDALLRPLSLLLAAARVRQRDASPHCVMQADHRLGEVPVGTLAKLRELGVDLVNASAVYDASAASWSLLEPTPQTAASDLLRTFLCGQIVLPFACRRDVPVLSSAAQLIRAVEIASEHDRSGVLLWAEHAPVTGATTALRQLAWSLAAKMPVLLVPTRLTDDQCLALRQCVSEVAAVAAGLRIVLVADGVPCESLLMLPEFEPKVIVVVAAPERCHVHMAGVHVVPLEGVFRPMLPPEDRSALVRSYRSCLGDVFGVAVRKFRDEFALELLPCLAALAVHAGDVVERVPSLSSFVRQYVAPLGQRRKALLLVLALCDAHKVQLIASAEPPGVRALVRELSVAVGPLLRKSPGGGVFLRHPVFARGVIGLLVSEQQDCASEGRASSSEQPDRELAGATPVALPAEQESARWPFAWPQQVDQPRKTALALSVVFRMLLSDAPWSYANRTTGSTLLHRLFFARGYPVLCSMFRSSQKQLAGLARQLWRDAGSCADGTVLVDARIKITKLLSWTGAVDEAYEWAKTTRAGELNASQRHQLALCYGWFAVHSSRSSADERQSAIQWALDTLASLKGARFSMTADFARVALADLVRKWRDADDEANDCLRS